MKGMDPRVASSHEANQEQHTSNNSLREGEEYQNPLLKFVNARRGAPCQREKSRQRGPLQESESIIAALLAAVAAGSISDVKTARAWTGAEFKAVAERASKAASHYRAPGKG
jgi:hypothetical protein